MNTQDKIVAEFSAGVGLVLIGLENAGWGIVVARSKHDSFKQWTRYGCDGLAPRKLARFETFGTRAKERLAIRCRVS